MSRRRRSYSRGTGSRRKLVWVRAHDTLSVAAAIAPALAVPTRVDLLSAFEASLGASPIGATVVRTRGYMQVSDVDPIANANIAFRACAYVGNNNEVQRGPDANDNAFDDLSENKDYFLFEPFFLAPTDADSVAVNGTDPASRMIDVKSSRKIEELNQTIILDVSADSSNLAVTSNTAFAFDLSLLLMLP